MFRRFSNLKLQYKILFAAILPAILALMIQSVISFNSSIRLMKEETIKNHRLMVQDACDKIYQQIHDMEMKVMSLYQDTELIYRLDTISNENGSPTIKTTGLAIDLFLKFGFRANLYGIYVYKPNGERISSYNTAGKFQHPFNLYDFPNIYQTEKIDLYQKSPATNTVITAYKNDKTGKNVLRMMSKIRNLFTGKDLATIVIDFTEEGISEILSPYQLQPEQSFILEDDTGTPLVIINNLNEGSALDHVHKLLQYTDTTGTGSIGDEVLVMSNDKKYGLRLISLIPLQYIPKSINKTTTTIVMASGILIVGVLILLFLISAKLTQPVKTLRDTMLAVEKGNLDIRAQVFGDDEIATLAHAFNQMLDRINSLITSEYKANLLKNSAELKALQAQVNPHFLYNTLAAMGRIAENQQAYQLRYICDALVSFYRYANQMSHQNASLSDEIYNLENYIYIQNARVPDGFKLRVRCDAKVMNMSLPRLLIQPLVENSIQHGLSEKKPPRLIKVSAYVREDTVYLSVLDNGEGMDKESLNKIRKELSDNNPGLDRSSSIGLINVNSRMRIMYGDDYCMDIISKLHKGTLIRLVFPFKGENA